MSFLCSTKSCKTCETIPSENVYDDEKFEKRSEENNVGNNQVSPELIEEITGANLELSIKERISNLTQLPNQLTNDNSVKLPNGIHSWSSTTHEVLARLVHFS